METDDPLSKINVSRPGASRSTPGPGSIGNANTSNSTLQDSSSSRFDPWILLWVVLGFIGLIIVILASYYILIPMFIKLIAMVRSDPVTAPVPK